jgi:diguanylate cyclase (GGDEF)-like protein
LAGEKEELARIEALYALANRDNDAALRELAAFQAQLPPDASYRVQIDAVKAQITMLFFAGRAREASAPLTRMRLIAEQQQDKAAIAVTIIWTAGQMLDDGRADAALVKLKEAEPIAKGSANADALLRLASSFGSVYTALGSFELALEHHLEALRIAEQLPEQRAQARLSELNSLSVLYMSMRNPEQALASTQQAQALAEANPQGTTNAALASIQINQGFALAELGRGAESLQAFERALKIARDNKLPAAEATVLLNISDYHLRQQAYPAAADYAHLAIAKAKQAGRKMSLGIATANLGLAVAGQGRVREGAAQVNAAIRIMHEAGAIVDEAGLLGELGQMYVRSGLHREAVEALLAQRSLNHEIFKSDRARAVAVLQEGFDAKQRRRQIEVLEGENKLKDAELRNRHLILVSVVLGATLTLIAVMFVSTLYRRARKANEALTRANSLLEFHAIHDPLTGLHNRRSFSRRMGQRPVAGVGLRSADAEPTPDGLVLMDIDNFKKINDTWGHTVGDAVLIEVANRIHRTVRDTDMALRWGGEEFVVFSPKCETGQHLRRLVSRLLQVIGETPIGVGVHQIRVTMSAGFVCLPFADVPEADCGWEKAMQLADLALYHAKNKGRNRAYGLTGLRAAWRQALPLLEHGLDAALDAGVLDVVEVAGPGQNDALTSP